MSYCIVSKPHARVIEVLTMLFPHMLHLVTYFAKMLTLVDDQMFEFDTIRFTLYSMVPSDHDIVHKNIGTNKEM